MNPDPRQIPSVDQLLHLPATAWLVESFGRTMTLKALRETLNTLRNNLLHGKVVDLTPESILTQTQNLLNTWFTPSLKPVINATGVILHTNLGRAPLSPSALQAISQIAPGYCNLEFDLETGRRGSRNLHATQLLTQLTGAEDALVVNNNAAAVLLVLSALAARRNVIVARSQLIEIGGGFRIPEILRQSRARLLEVGTTNRTRLEDFEKALHESGAALILRAHHSNFRIIGFTEEPSLNDLANLAHRYQIPLLDDLGSGTLVDTVKYGLAHEPMVQESLAANADLVCFSGDKLLGGPQAGIILGRKDLLEKIKRHPLARAVRADKITLAALSATLLHYLKGDWEQAIPVWRMIAQSAETIKIRASRWQDTLQVGNVIPSLSTVGGGSLPGETLPTFALALKVKSPSQTLKWLRTRPHPIIARIENDQVLLDPRTVLEEQEDLLLNELRHLLTQKAH
jgi:L-seryl-tRNA(Ser) seleniumtransferase